MYLVRTKEKNLTFYLLHNSYIWLTNMHKNNFKKLAKTNKYT